MPNSKVKALWFFQLIVTHDIGAFALYLALYVCMHMHVCMCGHKYIYINIYIPNEWLIPNVCAIDKLRLILNEPLLIPVAACAILSPWGLAPVCMLFMYVVNVVNVVYFIYVMYVCYLCCVCMLCILCMLYMLHKLFVFVM